MWNPACGAPRACYVTIRGRRSRTDAFATLTLVKGRWSNPQVWCPANAKPGVDQTALRDEAIRLLPPVQIGSAWTSTALVNAETILWARTSADRALPVVTVAGQRVAIRIHFAAARWDYGDGSTETLSAPGKPYDGANDPCHTAQCPDYRGHTYRSTGRMTITLAVTWHAQYRTAGTWIDIDDDITGPRTQHVLTVKQARAILVPNPSGH